MTDAHTPTDLVSRLRKEYVEQSARCGEEDSQERALLAQEAADEIERLRATAYPFCPHGARLGTPLSGMWNGPVAQCGCCHSAFGYIGSGSLSISAATGEVKVNNRVWAPKDRCGSCGGKYHEG